MNMNHNMPSDVNRASINVRQCISEFFSQVFETGLNNPFVPTHLIWANE